MKFFIDVTFSLLIFILIFPLSLLIFIILFLSLKDNPIFTQVRIGLQQKEFFIYKFRSMLDIYDHHGNLAPDHVRMTFFGKFLRNTSLDEIPQLVNVLKGDMSFVGPRPLLTEYLPLYNDRQRRRHEVKPGITGWAQVNGRNAISWQEKFELDVWYVENQSLTLDLKILWLTFLKVLKREGVNQDGQATMEKFTGNA